MAIAQLVFVFAVVLLLFGLFFAVASGSTWGRVRRDPAEVAAMLRGVLEGSVSEDEWQAFAARPIADPALDRVRKRCLFLEEEYPSERPGERCNEQGRELLRALIRSVEPEPEPEDESGPADPRGERGVPAPEVGPPELR